MHFRKKNFVGYPIHQNLYYFKKLSKLSEETYVDFKYRKLPNLNYIYTLYDLIYLYKNINIIILDEHWIEQIFIPHNCLYSKIIIKTFSQISTKIYLKDRNIVLRYNDSLVLEYVNDVWKISLNMCKLCCINEIKYLPNCNLYINTPSAIRNTDENLYGGNENFFYKINIIDLIETRSNFLYNYIHACDEITINITITNSNVSIPKILYKYCENTNRGVIINFTINKIENNFVLLFLLFYSQYLKINATAKFFIVIKLFRSLSSSSYYVYDILNFKPPLKKKYLEFSSNNVANENYLKQNRLNINWSLVTKKNNSPVFSIEFLFLFKHIFSNEELASYYRRFKLLVFLQRSMKDYLYKPPNGRMYFKTLNHFYNICNKKPHEYIN